MNSNLVFLSVTLLTALAPRGLKITLIQEIRKTLSKQLRHIKYNDKCYSAVTCQVSLNLSQYYWIALLCISSSFRVLHTP